MLNESRVLVNFKAGFYAFVIVIVLAVILAGILVPVYADEVGLRIMRSTFFSERGRILSLMPQCRSDVGLTIPWSWIPAAIGSSLLMSNLSPIGIRVAGLATAVLWIASLVIAVRILIPKRMDQLRWISAILAILGLGVLPLTLVLARSEQWLLLLLTVFTIFPFVLQRINWVQYRFGLVGLLALFCVLVSFAFYAHPKALFFLPLLAVSAYCSFYARGRFIFLVAVSFLLWTAFQTVEVTRFLVACPDAPIFAAYMASQTTKLSMLRQAPVDTLWELWTNLATAPDSIGKHLLFQSAYQSAWLPPEPIADIGQLARMVNSTISSAIWLVIWGGLLLPLVAFGISIKRRDFGQVFMVLTALWVGVGAHLAIYKVWNFYGGARFLACRCCSFFSALSRLSWPIAHVWLANGFAWGSA